MSELQNDGIPAGYRLVGVRRVKTGDKYVARDGSIWTAGVLTQQGDVFPVVEAIPSIPSKKKITLVLNRYLLGEINEDKLLTFLVCTPEYVERHQQLFEGYRLVEHVQTLEVEVDV